MSISNRIITAEKAAENAEQMNRRTGVIIGAAIEVHRLLGPGLLVLNSLNILNKSHEQLLAARIKNTLITRWANYYSPLRALRSQR